MALRPEEKFKYKGMYGGPWTVYGDFEDLDDVVYLPYAENVFFLVGTVLVVPLVILNLLIALMGDTFSKVQGSQESGDVLEKIKLIKEVTKFMFWRRASKIKNYIHHQTSKRLTESDEVKEGKLSKLQKYIVKVGSSINDMKNAQLRESAVLAEQLADMKAELSTI